MRSSASFTRPGRLLLAVLVLAAIASACGGNRATPARVIPPTQAAPPTQPLPTVAPTATIPPEPTATPLSLTDLGSEFRTFVNEKHGWSLQLPLDWQVRPENARTLDSVEFSMPGLDEVRGPNVLPPLVFTVRRLEDATGYSEPADVEQAQGFGDEMLGAADLQVNDLPARLVYTRDSVYGNSRYYIIQRDDEFFIVHAYGYDQPPIEPVLQTFGRAPETPRTTVSGEVVTVDPEAQTMVVATDGSGERPVRWFSDTELLPRGWREGHIDPEDGLTAEGREADDGTLHASTITFNVPQHDGNEAILEFRRSGGVAGFQDRLTIFADGFARLERGSGDPIEQPLTDELWDQIDNEILLFRPFAWHQEDNPGGPDNMVSDLDFYGRGRFETAPENEAEIVDHVQAVLTTLTSAN